MLVNESQNRTWTAVSAVLVDHESDKWDGVMYMTASYNGKEVNFSKSIQNQELYEKNKDAVKADYDSFEAKVESEIQR